MRAVLIILGMIWIAGAEKLAAQGADLWSGAFSSFASPPESISILSCRSIANAVDLSTSSGDHDLVGLAQDASRGRWFISGARGGRGAIWIFDSDLMGLPDPATARALPAAPGARGGWWKHRDGEWDPVGGMVYFGDEAQTIFELDPAREQWTSRSWTLTGSSTAVMRAFACESDPALGILRVFVGDWTTPIEEWELDLTSSAARLVATHPINTGGLYGLTLVTGPSGPRSALVLYSQRPHNCVSGRGRILIELFDRTNGASLYARAADWRVPDAFFPEGGAAGGIQLASVGGQLAFACLQQGWRDVISVIPFQGFSTLSAPTCDAALRVENAPRPGQAISFCLAASSVPQWGFISLSLLPAAPIDLDCGALEIGGGALPWIEVPLLSGMACAGPYSVPRGVSVWGTEIVVDALLVDLAGRLISTNRVDVFIAPRCF